jgi:hypothetical protein
MSVAKLAAAMPNKDREATCFIFGSAIAIAPAHLQCEVAVVT